MVFYVRSAKLARLSLGLKTGYVAEELNISRRTLWTWESGRNTPSEKMIRKLADVLKVNISDISDLPDESLFSKDNLMKKSSLNYDTDALNEFDIKFSSMINNLKDIYTKAIDSNFTTKALLAADKTIFYIKTTSLKYVVACNYYKKILGYPEDYVLKNKNDNNIMSFKDAKINENHEREILLSGIPVSNLEMVIPGTKGKRWGVFSKSPVIDKYGKISGIVVNGVDITELRTEQERIAYTIGTAAKDKSIIWRAKFNSNRKLNCKFISKEEADKSFGEKVADRIIDSVRVSREITNIESRKHYTHVFNISVNNKEDWIKETIYCDNKNYYGVVKSYTEKKSIKRLRKTLELNFANMKDGVVIQHDISKEIIYANRAVELIYERNLNDYYGKNIDDVWLNELVHPEDQMLLKELYDKDKYPTRRVFRIITPGGRIKWIEATVSYRIIADGIPTVITIDRDITDRVANEEKNYLIKTFFDNINGFIIIYNKSKILYVSDAINSFLDIEPFQIYKDINLFTECVYKTDGLKKLNFTFMDLLDCNNSHFFIKNKNNETVKFKSSFLKMKTGEKYVRTFEPVIE